MSTIEIAGRRTVSEPGIYADITDVDYHADPVAGGSLSRSGARKLLPPSTPAQFKYEQDNPPPSKPVFEEGKAAHRLVLGAGPELVKLPFDSMRTNAAKEFAAEAEERGAICLKDETWDRVHAMANRLREHPIASALLDPEKGHPEQSMFWDDPETGVTLRARLDWLPDLSPSGRLIVPDYKTAASADPHEFARKAADFGYDMQDPWYLDGLRALGIAEDLAFVFIVQSKTLPYPVSVVQLHDVDRAIGAQRNRRAIETYAHCKATDTWPGYDDVTVVELPTWYRIQNGA